eukprot:CAMPEP_0184531376 /NCGR_PEP_ID=MMETSP0198_2-20121128/13509_1 /TAXON_ID=1112570 /ORGANISM="Thraustochytrium sp., Strain LLF1b" /LENGTH=68 /DNA_ID=CAMNT_0026923719 /DNA_START=91 /DNA_END=294 /DNA_ORIENTATION=-
MNEVVRSMRELKEKCASSTLFENILVVKSDGAVLRSHLTGEDFVLGLTRAASGIAEGSLVVQALDGNV